MPGFLYLSGEHFKSHLCDCLQPVCTFIFHAVKHIASAFKDCLFEQFQTSLRQDLGYHISHFLESMIQEHIKEHFVFKVLSIFDTLQNSALNNYLKSLSIVSDNLEEKIHCGWQMLVLRRINQHFKNELV